ncbi:hypothetical protein [Citricoccus sp. GCM10030269]|uniref:hypothetical protein n=1 Tax=Citricoccus sp. GCM10030269 TaxID=3273388 RepID=UPI00360F0BD1
MSSALPPIATLPSHAIHQELSDGVVTVTAWDIPLKHSSESAYDEDRAHVLHRSAQSSDLIRLRPGVFVPADVWTEAYPRERHLATALAIALSARQTPLFCRETALLLYGLPLNEARVDVRLRAFSSGAARRTFRATPAAAAWPLMSEQRISVPRAWTRDEIQKLEPARPARLAISHGRELMTEDLRFCIADTLHRLTFGDAVMVADALLSGLRSTHDGGLARTATPWARSELAALAGLCTTKKAARKLLQVAEFAQPLSDSPGESLSRARIHELGFQAPELQHRLYDAQGRFLGMVDFWWPELRLAGEFDGWGKYTDAESYSGQNRDTVFREEKSRSERIQEQGIRFVRWMWKDVENPQLLEQRLQRAGVPRA